MCLVVFSLSLVDLTPPPPTLLVSRTDVIGEVAFGVCIGALANENLPFVTAFDSIQECCVQRGFLPFWKLFKFLRVAREREITRCAQVIDDFAYGILHVIVTDWCGCEHDPAEG